MVSKEEILAEVWQGVAATDNVLTRVIAQLRKALGDEARVARSIETAPTVGYRFAAPVEEVSGVASQSNGDNQTPPDALDSARKRQFVVRGPAARRWLWAALAVFGIAGLAWWVTQRFPATLVTNLWPLPRQVSAVLG